MLEKDARIYVAGHTGLVGSAFVRALRRRGFTNLILRTHNELELTEQVSVEAFFEAERPEYVIDAAAKVGGIRANSDSPAEFFYENMQIEQNLIWTAYNHGVKKFLFLGSACMYPRDCAQPMREQDLLTGLPEPTNEGYALAKICGQRLGAYLRREYGADFITAIPANAYGMGDSFDPLNSHVIPALLLKCENAKNCGDKAVTLWGTGTALREFIDTDDLADAGIFLLENYTGEEPVNIGTGEEITMLDLARLIAKVTGFDGMIETDSTKPDGMPRRICDSTRIRELGWTPRISLEHGIARLYRWYKEGASDGTV